MRQGKTSFYKIIVAFMLIMSLGSGPAWGVVAVPPPALNPLNQTVVPEPPNLAVYVKNKPAAIALGKAFFWDMQVGSDGIVACATCHFSAGVDKRLKNTLNPGTQVRRHDLRQQSRDGAERFPRLWTELHLESPDRFPLPPAGESRRRAEFRRFARHQ